MSAISFTDNFVLTIDGKKVSSRETKDVINPATEEPVGAVPLTTREQLEEAVDGATRAFPVWSATPVEKRQEKLIELANMIGKHLPQLTQLLMKETGKPKLIAELEVGACIGWLKGSAAFSLPDEVVVDTPERKVITRYVPLGVCAAIIPWNFPLSIMIWKLAPALLTGNCLIVKPSPFAPLASLKLGELAQQLFPPGVISFLSGNDELGPWISEHPRIAKVSLTGSVGAGKAVMKSASSNLKRITLELGGNDAAIILDDVDPQAIAPKLFQGMFSNSGQICVALKRVYVHEKVYDAVRDALVAHAKKIKVGDPSDPSTEIGPIQNRVQFGKVISFFEDCHKNGYQFAVGGEVNKNIKGYFLPLSIVDNPPDTSRIVQEEPFGPIAPLLKWSDEEEVVKRANDTIFGLGASVWSSDINRAEKIARQLQAGTVWINECMAFKWDQPFGGFKQSGIGLEHSRHGLYTWVNIQSMTLNQTNQSLKIV